MPSTHVRLITDLPYVDNLAPGQHKIDKGTLVPVVSWDDASGKPIVKLPNGSVVPLEEGEFARVTMGEVADAVSVAHLNAPKVTLMRAWITPDCRYHRGDAGAVEEAFRRVRAAYDEAIRRDPTATLHVELRIESPNGVRRS